MTEKRKKYLILVGGVLVCILLICVIGVQFRKKEEQTMIVLETETESETDLIIEPDTIGMCQKILFTHFVYFVFPPILQVDQ